MKKILLVSYYWDQKNSIGRQRWYNLVNELIKENQLSSLLSFKGRDTWKIWDINLKDEKKFYDLKSLMIQTLVRHGILSIGSNNINFSHKQIEIGSIIKGYEKLFKLINLLRFTFTHKKYIAKLKKHKIIFPCKINYLGSLWVARMTTK